MFHSNIKEVPARKLYHHEHAHQKDKGMTKNTTKTFINMDKKCRKNNKSTASKSTDKSEWSELEYGWVKKVSNILCVVISLGTYR